MKACVPVILSISLLFVSCQSFSEEPSKTIHKPDDTIKSAPVSKSSSEKSSKNTYKWQSINGVWKLHKDKKPPFLMQTRFKPVQWNMNEPINNNSMATITPVKEYTSIMISAEIIKTTELPSSLILFFAAKNNNRDLYAFKITGDENNLHSVSLIRSAVKDASMPNSEKGNFVIDEIRSGQCSIEYEKVNNYEIKIRNKTVALYVGAKKLLEARTVDNLNSGVIGFGVRGPQIKIYNVRISNGKKTVLNDNFSQDSIKIPTIVVKRMTKEEYEKMMKEKKEKEERDLK